MGGKPWFLDAHYGGPAVLRSERACHERRAAWQLDCGNASTVRARFVATGNVTGVSHLASLPRPTPRSPLMEEAKRTVLLVRHGQGTHNRPSHGATNSYAQRDPSLTEHGQSQAAALRDDPRLRAAELIVVSPLRRAVQTAIAAFGEQRLARGGVALTPLHSERWSAPCDEGSTKSELASAFPLVRQWEGWDELSEQWSPTQSNDARWQSVRVPAFLAWLQKRPENKIVVVGHVAFFAAILGRNLRNCEVAELAQDPPSTA